MTVPVPRVELAPGVTVPRLINGCWQLAADHRTDPREESALLAELEALAERGLDTFDCADIYTGVEDRLGRLRQRWVDAGRDPSALRMHTKFVPDLEVLPTIQRSDVEQILERSCKRLGVERLDLVQFHWWDFSIPGWIETAHWLDELRREGLVRHLGVTNFDAVHLKGLLDAGVEIVSNQVQVSPLDRRALRGATAELCQRHDIALLAYGTLAGGLLTDRWLGADDPGIAVTRKAPGTLENRSLVKYRLIVEEFGGWEAFQDLLRAMRQVADRRGEGLSMAQVALAWTLGQPGVAAALLGFCGLERAEANLQACALELNAKEHRMLDAVLEHHPGPQGDVYSLEREPSGRHGAIMKTGLNQQT